MLRIDRRPSTAGRPVRRLCGDSLLPLCLGLLAAAATGQPAPESDSAAAPAPSAPVTDASAAAGSGQNAEAADAAAPAEQAAFGVVERLHGAIVDAASAGETFADRYARLGPVVRETHDLAFIAELTIRRQWRDLDDAARAAFVDAFERLSVSTYASRFAAAGSDTFRMNAAKSLDDGRIEVSAEIVRNDAPNVPLDYLLQRDGDTWRIVNIVADGVSDLALKRAQYQQVFRDGGSIDDLIAVIEAEADAL